MVDSSELEILQTASAVIDAVGGTTPAARLTKSKIASVSNCRASGRLPSRTFLVYRAALAELGKTAPAALWGIEEPQVLDRGS